MILEISAVKTAPSFAVPVIETDPLAASFTFSTSIWNFEADFFPPASSTLRTTS